jgi:type VI protein secretion system component Hcp
MSDSSQPAIFLSYQGVTGDQLLPGDTVGPGPGQDWCELLSCSFSAAVNTQARAVSGGRSQRLDLGGQAPPLRITKRTDAATVALMRDAVSTAVHRSAVIVFVRTYESGPAEYLRLDLHSCKIAAFDIFSSGDDRAEETFALHYQSLDIISFAGGHGAKGAQSMATLLNGFA